MKNEILDHLLDIKERLASVETKQDQINTVVKKVSELEQEIVKVQTTIKIYQWAAGVMIALAGVIVKVWSKN